MTRPLIKARINDLEALFARSKGDLATLRNIGEELGKRKPTERVDKLAVRVQEEIDNCERTSQVANDLWLPSRNNDAAPISNVTPPPAALQRPRAVAEPITNAPEKILAAWTGLEVLSPSSFKRPEELKGDGSLFEMDGRHLPWNGQGEKSRPQRRLYYQLVLGVIDMEKAVNQLLQKYSDARIERPAAQGKAALAVLVLDNKGVPIEDQAVTISSFGWGVPRALQGGFK